MDHIQFFVCIKKKVKADFGQYFDPARLDTLGLSLSHSRKYSRSGEQYRSRTSKVPAFYNPNSHCLHIDLEVVETASEHLIENIYYHELIHAVSNHERIYRAGQKILKSGLKIQVWDQDEKQSVRYRGLNEGMTQFFANMYTEGGSAYKNEVKIVGKLVRRIGLTELQGAYFGPSIQLLEDKISANFGNGCLTRLSNLIDRRHYERAEALIEA